MPVTRLLARIAPSADVAASLDVAAQHARRRGSLDAAAELTQLALRKTPPSIGRTS